MPINYSTTTYGSTADCSTMLHHWLIQKKSFYQAVKTDPVLSMFYKKLMRNQGIGQTDIVKLHMGNTHQTMAIGEADAFITSANSGKPAVVDSSAILNKTLTSRLALSGKQKRALDKEFEKITGETLNDATSEFVDSFKNNLLRCVVNDGTGFLSYAYNASSSTTVYLQDKDGNNLDSGHWIWNFLYPGMIVDVVTYATGVNITNGLDNIITAVTPASGTITLTTAVTADTAATYMIRYTTPWTDNGTSATTALQVEPDGIAGMVYSGNTHNSGATVSYLGKSATTYPRWTSNTIDAGTNASLTVKLLDQAIYRVQGTPNVIMCDPAVISQFKYEAEAMKKLVPTDDASLGYKRVTYMSSKGPIVLIDPYYLYGTKRCYVLDTSTFLTKGTVFEPQMQRGALTLNQTNDIWFDDAISEYENICVQRNANTYIYDLQAAW